MAEVEFDENGLPKRKRGRPSKAQKEERERLLRELEVQKAQPREFNVPGAFLPLYEPYRYKVYWGGRGAAKSWQFADAILIQGWEKPIRVLCTRELQKSIRESVHQLLRDRIRALGLQGEYEVTDAEIRGRNGTLIIFRGVKNNPEEIKSMEGIDICWIEEAQKITNESLSILIPTIRKAGSEIWVSMNPKSRNGATYVRFIENPPSNAYVRKVSWRDNPWFPEVLKTEMEDLKARDYDEYLHVWEGEFKAFADGAYYRKELIKAKEEKRIGRVSYDPVLKVYTVWDLGVGDSTAIWFAQMYKQEIRLIDYYEMSGEGLPHYAKILQGKPYVYGGHFAPHDIRVRELGSGKSRLEQAASLGINFDIVQNIPVDDGIAAVRATFPLCWFDEVKCARGLECLANYHREWDEDRGDWRLRPEHDWSSHGADAFRYLCIGLKERAPYIQAKPAYPQLQNETDAWMVF